MDASTEESKGINFSTRQYNHLFANHNYQKTIIKMSGAKQGEGQVKEKKKTKSSMEGKGKGREKIRWEIR